MFAHPASIIARFPLSLSLLGSSLVFAQSPISDIVILSSCLPVSSSGQCASTEFNNDSIADFNLLPSPPGFQQIAARKINEGENDTFYIWAEDTQDDMVAYTVKNKPLTASYMPVIMGDFNGDTIVNDEDINLITISADQLYEQRFDLNNDFQVDQLDVDLLQNLLVGRSRTALLFSWFPGPQESGLYEIVVSAEDGTNLISRATIKLTVYDMDALENYYSYDDVLLIVNNQSEASQMIGQYFSESRGIPTSRILTISTPENETVSRQTFEQDIRLPIARFISDNGLNSVINYIVTTKGVPLRISADQVAADQASVDSELSLISGHFADQIGAVNATQNPYHDFDFIFSREMFGIFLVTRLTGYTVNDVLTLIDRSSQAEQSGTFVLDVDPSKDNIIGLAFANRWLREAAQNLETAGHFVFLDETTSFVTQQTNILGYASWGSNDANDTNNAKPEFVWLPGSIAETFVSSSARTFTAPVTYGQSLVADLIAEGATGAKGYVYEPFLGAMARPNILFDRYAKGFTLADSFFSASSSLGWQGVVIGDPKMAISNYIQNRKANDAGAAQDNGKQPTGSGNTAGSGSVDPWTFTLLLLMASIKLFGYRGRNNGVVHKPVQVNRSD